MRELVVLAAVSALGLSPAFAATSVPKISGAYATIYNEICQAGNPTNPTLGTGQTYTQMLVITFDEATMKMSMKGTSVTGPLSGPFTPLEESPIALSSIVYSNSATKLKVGQSSFTVVYGPVDGSGIALSLVFGGISRAGCAASATAIRQ